MKSRSLNINYKWLVNASIFSFILAVVLNFSSDILLKKSNIIIAFFVLLLIVFTGILFDIIGIAVATGNEEPFHSMAANKVLGAKQSIRLIRNANIVTNFCNDIVGDICGIVSGAALTSIILKLSITGTKSTIYTTIFGGILSAITIGGKAIGKSFGIYKSQSIVYWVGIFLAWIEKNIGINIFPDRRNKNRK
ncbi:hypothetical protein [Thermoanaerobacterium sp. RBIITD]|uniref:hypothetical protein n=1 Tax=Thermoanaerobacterium sp. RBIITD TaxID=1550240 RepID=UPI000BB7CB6F|nr:hypothetical protein [Thermoanaerobacterium sp. RBIITD]SNX55372.1 hypothetical protein SAMN05660242_3195 [Thermoanaerobacterium sp. RBIITD]